MTSAWKTGREIGEPNTDPTDTVFYLQQKLYKEWIYPLVVNAR